MRKLVGIVAWLFLFVAVVCSPVSTALAAEQSLLEKAKALSGKNLSASELKSLFAGNSIRSEHTIRRGSSVGDTYYLIRYMKPNGEMHFYNSWREETYSTEWRATKADGFCYKSLRRGSWGCRANSRVSVTGKKITVTQTRTDGSGKRTYLLLKGKDERVSN